MTGLSLTILQMTRDNFERAVAGNQKLANRFSFGDDNSVAVKGQDIYYMEELLDKTIYHKYACR